MDLCMLIPAIACLIGAILGYLLGKATSKGNNENSKEIENWKNKYAVLEADLDDCKKQSSSTSKKSGSTNKVTPSVESSIAPKTEEKTPEPPKAEEVPVVVPEITNAPVAAIAFSADLAKSVFGKKIKQDDLRIVEGVGPKIAELFINNGVKTWSQLSECSVEKCQEILATGGDRYKMHNPGTWPKQAQLAHEGKWQQLYDWQNSLDGGKQ